MKILKSGIIISFLTLFTIGCSDNNPTQSTQPTQHHLTLSIGMSTNTGGIIAKVLVSLEKNKHHAKGITVKCVYLSRDYDAWSWCLYDIDSVLVTPLRAPQGYVVRLDEIFENEWCDSSVHQIELWWTNRKI